MFGYMLLETKTNPYDLYKLFNETHPRQLAVIKMMTLNPGIYNGFTHGSTTNEKQIIQES